MGNIVTIIKRKPATFLFISLGYLVLVGFLKWNIHPPLSMVWYLIGGLFGVYFLDIAEVFFHLVPSPFRTIVFAIGFMGVSLFIVTSSGSLLASGLVLSLYLTLMFWQIGEWQLHGNLNDWYRMIASPVTPVMQQLLLVGFIVVFFVETLSFIRIS
ncbi:hypothetical protein A2Z00_03275 [Candidatus Gottesmanbacteria bacterium RBG_13_45_10]|uniref:Uncharacterized protein n=1 Tax=Candidatus Gottesmanbacteria bacterium RBG_13_45_10 TaxID=1798370 RepID=A0A1F5ZHN3_9BACT|nr:MAG: hypothetical protein A2Z00_03275 [Candidatus Gottesmanbacteria bacterium RBG_13_45_10]